MSTLDHSGAKTGGVPSYKEDDGVGPTVGTTLALTHITFLAGARSSPLDWESWLGAHTDPFPGCIAFGTAPEMH